MYSLTCGKQHYIMWSLLIKQSVVKVSHLFPLNYCNFHLYLAVISIGCGHPLLSPLLILNNNLKQNHSKKTKNNLSG